MTLCRKKLGKKLKYFQSWPLWRLYILIYLSRNVKINLKQTTRIGRLAVFIFTDIQMRSRLEQVTQLLILRLEHHDLDLTLKVKLNIHWKYLTSSLSPDCRWSEIPARDYGTYIPFSAEVCIEFFQTPLGLQSCVPSFSGSHQSQ